MVLPSNNLTEIDFDLFSLVDSSSSRRTPRQSSSVIGPSAGSALFQTPRNSSRRSNTRGFSSGRDSSSDSTSSNHRKDSLRSACRIAGRCICNSVDCGVLPARSSSSVRNMVTAQRSSRTPHSQHRTTVDAGMSNGTFVTPLTRPRLTESEIRQLQQMNLNQRRSGSTGRNGNGNSAGRQISTVMKDKEKSNSSGRTAGSSASLLEEYNSTASYSSTTLNTSSTLLISSTRSTRSTKSSGYDSGEVTTDIDTSRSKSSIVEDTSGSSHSRTMEESQIFKRNQKQNQQESHDRDRVRFSFGMSSDEDEAGVLSRSSRFPTVEDDRLSNSTTQSAVSAISQASERSIKIIKDVYQATKNCGSRIVSAAGGGQQQDSNGTSVPLKSSLKKRPEIIYSSSSRNRDSNSQNHNSSYRGFSCDNANNSFYTERRRRAKEATAAALSSRYDSDSEWYDEDEEESSSMSMSTARSFMNRIGNSAKVLIGFICAPIYWILVQFFVFEKWILNSTSRSHSRVSAAGLAAGDSRTTADLVYGAARHQHPKIPDHTCNPNPTPTGVGGGDRPRGPRRRNDVNGGAAAATRATRDGDGDGGDGSSSPVFWRLLLILIPLLLCGYGCYYYGGAGDNTQNTATLLHDTETSSTRGRSLHASVVPPESLPPTECPPPSVPATECPQPWASTTASSTSSEDLLRVSNELADLRQQVLVSQSVPPPECPTCQLYDDTAMKEEDKILKQYVLNLENRIKELTANLGKLEAASKEKSCPDPVPPNPAESVRYEQTVGAVSSQETRVIVDQYLEKKMGTIVENMSAKNRELIRAAINQYDADKTGRPDLALESGGGSVVSTRCTKKSDFAGSYVSILGFPVFWPSNSPRRVIQPGMMPGDCWSFDGAEGFIVLKLVAPTRVTGFTLEHLPKSISPLGHIDSAPKKFQVVGLTDYEDLSTEFLFGEYQYDDNSIPIQYFDVQNSSDMYFPYVELKILSNHGNLDYTCLYRFRVHGYLESWLTIGPS